MSKTHVHTVAVQFGHCDPAGIVFFPNFSRWMDEASLAFFMACGVPPEIMGIGPAPAIRRLLDGAGLKLDDIARFEVNEAQGAQTLAVAKELEIFF